MQPGESPIFRRWAKAAADGSWHLLPFHGLDVAAVLDAGLEARPELLEELADTLAVPPAGLRALLLALAALHDLGKVGSAFQAQRPDICRVLGIDATGLAPYRRVYGHDHLGFLLLRDHPRLRAVLAADDPRRRLRVRDPLVAVFTGHHGRQPPAGLGLADFRAARQCRNEDREAAHALVEAIFDLFGLEDAVPVDADGLHRASFVLNGLVTLVDWLGSGDDFAFEAEPRPLEDYYETRARPTARELLERLRPWPFDRPRRRAPVRFRDLAPEFAPTPLQQAVETRLTAPVLGDGPALVLIQDATGAGKTEAADLALQRLVACGHGDSAYIALPTMATADAAFARRRQEGGMGLAALLHEDPTEPMLAHSRALRGRWRGFARRDEGEPGEPPAEAWFARSSRRVLLARLGVGTVDQALLGVLRVRHATVRLAGLMRKVLVVDEVHAFDDHLLALLEELLRHQARRGDSAILLSATLAGRQRARLVRAFAEGAGWPDVDARLAALPAARLPVLAVLHAKGVSCPPLPSPPPRPIPLAFTADLEACIRHLIERACEGRSGIWFRNTVDDAVEGFLRLCERAERAGLPPPILYHARFLGRDRAAAERRLLTLAGPGSGATERRGRLVVATQAAEQSLDLDFDELVSDLAPVDVLIQRLGRFRRHPRDIDGTRLGGPPDRRPRTRALVYAPAADVPAGPNWYRDFLPRAAAVYDDVARLWLGLHRLRAFSARGAFDPAVDGPRLLDEIYRPAEELAAELPPSLHEALYAREGEAFVRRETARRGRLDTARGLLAAWRADADLPETDTVPTTRLGESWEVVLVARQGEAVRFLVEEEDPLEDSRVRVPWEPAWEGEAGLLDRLAARLEAHGRDRGLPARVIAGDLRRLRFERILPLQPAADGWRGRFRTPRGDVELCYHPRLGLHRIG